MNISQLILKYGKENNKSKEELLVKIIKELKANKEEINIYKIKCILNELIRYIKTKKRGKWRKLKLIENDRFQILERDKYDY
jgi:hypothetical protein